MIDESKDGLSSRRRAECQGRKLRRQGMCQDVRLSIYRSETPGDDFGLDGSLSSSMGQVETHPEGNYFGRLVL